MNPKSKIENPKSDELFFTADPEVIADLHARGEKEIAIRNGREYVFKLADVQSLKVQSSMSNLEHETLNLEPTRKRGEKDAENS